MRACARLISAAPRRARRYNMTDDLYSLRGKNTVVTGAGAGIGRAVALAFARAGANVACIDLDGDAAEATSREATKSGQRAIGIACDVGSENNVKAAADKVLQEFTAVT